MIPSLWLGVVAVSALAVYAAAVAFPGRMFSSRALPRDLIRLITGAAFAATVHPAFGILAALSAYWWVQQGYLGVAGGTFWPLVASGVWLGLQAPSWGFDLAIALLLATGVAQVALGVLQACGAPIFLHPSMIHGTLGHRTGYGIYLACLMPLAFLSGWGGWLAGAYAVGIILSRSTVAAVAGMVGLLVVLPSGWPIGLGIIALVFLSRGMKFHTIYRGEFGWGGMKFRHVPDSLRARFAIWRALLAEMAGRHWLIGHGAHAFATHSRSWIYKHGLKENYQEAHNDYLEFLFEYGLIGVAAALLWLIECPWSWSDPYTGASAALGVSMLANFPMRVAPVAVVALVLVIAFMRRTA